jgi:hypothetical protein
MRNATQQSETQNSQPAIVDASELMLGQRRSARILLATIVILLGLASIALCGFPWSAAAVSLLVLVAFVWSGHTAWLFLFCLAVVCGQAFGGFLNRPSGYFSLSETFQTVCVFLILITGFRYAEMKKYVFAFGIDEVSKNNAARRGTFSWSVLEVAVRRQWLFSVIALFAASCLLLYLPADDSYLYDYWLQPKPGRMIIISLVLFFAWFVCRAAVSVLDWTAFTPDKADVAFRSWYNKEMWREMAGVEKRRQKLRRDNNRD